MAWSAVWLTACGGAGSATRDAAAAPGVESGGGTTLAPTPDAATDATGDASDGAESDAAAAYDGPPVTQNEVCHVLWPQPDGFDFSGGKFSLAVDPSGNTYVQILYYANPPSAPALDLGVSSPGDAIGVAIAKVDPQCNLLWMRELGSPSRTALSSIDGTIAVDSASNLTFAARFCGTIDLGAGPVEGGDCSGFVVRLDPDGNRVFTNMYLGVLPDLLSVGPGGTTTLLMYDYFGFEGYLCRLEDGGCEFGLSADGGTTEAGTTDGGTPSFYSVVELGATGAELARNPFAYPSAGQAFVSPATDSSGRIWGLENGAGWDPMNVPLLVQLTQDGTPLWSEPSDISLFALTPAGAVALLSTAGETLEAIASDGGLLWTQASPLPASAPHPTRIAVDPAGTIYLGGQVGPQDSSSVGVQVLDALGRLQSIRTWSNGGSPTTYQSFGVDRNGNAVVGGYTAANDAGTAFFVVRLGP